MTSYKGLLNKIEAFCSAHFQIEKYAGEFKEQMPNFATKDEKYPIVYVVPQSDTSDLNTNQFTVDVYCVDIIQKDRANINNIVSDCNLIVNDLYLYFLDGNDLSIDVVGSSSGDPVNNFDLDYTAGWVKTITFEVNQYNVCAIPMSPINPNPPVTCDPANYNLVDTLDNILSSGSINSGATSDIVVGNSKVENSDATYSEEILAEGSLVLPDITINVVNTASTIVDTQIVPSVQDATVGAPDATVNIKKTGDGTIASISAPSGATTDYSVADNAITVNSGNGFSIDATDPLDIVLTDGTSTVTPTSVTYSQGQHKVDIVLPPNVQLYNSAELTRTGQTTSYATGDDGDLEKGRGGSFFLLPYNSPFGNTNRFTSDNFSAQTTYTNNIVIDWSTYNGTTVLGYKRTIMSSAVWATQVANCLALSFGGYTSGWRLCNVQEYQNIANYSLSQTFNYAPFNLSTTSYQHTSTTDPGNTNSALKFYNPGGWCLGDSKLNSATAIACRTFTVTGTTLS